MAKRRLRIVTTEYQTEEEARGNAGPLDKVIRAMDENDNIVWVVVSTEYR